ncbi:MAG: biotin--[acetyl-CoA-carboxylase] ligase [Lachnospiraceae bacterium]|nr:biotin--[acetyl-CoA-carboxylase] ligase [Lachnospiraceae bacterium]
MKTKILILLRNATDYISGQELCEELGVSRTAVWKVMNQLKEEGYIINSIQNKGYKIEHIPDVMTKSEIASRLGTRWAGRNLYCYEEVGSTNMIAKKKAEESEPHGTLIVADKQTTGRGRRGRSWESPAGTDIYMTLSLKPEFTPDKASMLTLVMAQAVTNAIEEASGLSSGIKWPNDIVVNGKKVCGILTEMSAELDYIHYVVIGVGINVNLPEVSEELKVTATSLFIEGRKKIMRAQIIERVMHYFEEYYELFLQTEDLSGLLNVYNHSLVNCDREVRVLDPKGEYIGTARGINELGELLVEKAEGEIVRVYAGEVSVRGLYGYV